MHLQKIEIENFKSFGDKRALEFALPSEGDRKSGLTLLVGANNSGKTSVIDAIRLVCNDTNTFDRNERRKDGLPNIVLARVGGAEYQITKSDISSFGIKRTVIQGFDHTSIRIVSARRSWNSASDIGIHNDNAY